MKRRILPGAALACTLSGMPIAAPAAHCCPVIELRQYTLHPGKRDVLIALFEQHFIESQEAAGMRIVATFRDQANPDRFVWIRGFAHMQQRHDALTAFYYGPVWQAYREQANATLADNDNVLLLRPAFAGSGFLLDGLARPAPGSASAARRVVATIYYLRRDTLPAFAATFRSVLAPLLQQHGVHILAQLVSEYSANTFTRLPVRENVHVFVSITVFDDAASYVRQREAIETDQRWRDALIGYAGVMAHAPEHLLLEPTVRSLVR